MVVYPVNRIKPPSAERAFPKPSNAGEAGPAGHASWILANLPARFQEAVGEAIAEPISWQLFELPPSQGLRCEAKLRRRSLQSRLPSGRGFNLLSSTLPHTTRREGLDLTQSMCSRDETR